MLRRIVVVGLALLVMLVAAACGRGQPAAQVSGPSTTVNVAEKEWTITLAPDTVAPGPRTFAVKNEGTIEHNFVIQGLNIRAEGIQVGQTRTVSADLKPGTYTIICDLPGHAEAGMKATLTVK